MTATVPTSSDLNSISTGILIFFLLTGTKYLSIHWRTAILGKTSTCGSPSVAALDLTLGSRAAAAGREKIRRGMATSPSPQQPAGEAAASVFSATHKQNCWLFLNPRMKRWGYLKMRDRICMFAWRIFLSNYAWDDYSSHKWESREWVVHDRRNRSYLVSKFNMCYIFA